MSTGKTRKISKIFNQTGAVGLVLAGLMAGGGAMAHDGAQANEVWPMDGSGRVDVSYTRVLGAIEALGGMDAGEVKDEAGAFEALQQMHLHENSKIAALYSHISTQVQLRCYAGVVAVCPQDVRSDVFALYNSFQPSVDYAQWSENRDETLELALSEAGYDSAPEAWDTMTGHDRLAHFEPWLALHSDVYSEVGFELVAPIMMVDETADNTIALFEDKHASRGGDLPVIVFNQNLINELEYDEFSFVMRHELQHYVQFGMIDALESQNGLEYLQKHGIDGDAVIFKETLHVLMLPFMLVVDEAWSRDGYLQRPMEQDARRMQKGGVMGVEALGS